MKTKFYLKEVIMNGVDVTDEMKDLKKKYDIEIQHYDNEIDLNLHYVVSCMKNFVEMWEKREASIEKLEQLNEKLGLEDEDE